MTRPESLVWKNRFYPNFYCTLILSLCDTISNYLAQCPNSFNLSQLLTLISFNLIHYHQWITLTYVCFRKTRPRKSCEHIFSVIKLLFKIYFQPSLRNILKYFTLFPFQNCTLNIICVVNNTLIIGGGCQLEWIRKPSLKI